MASNTHRHGQGITSGVNLNIFRSKKNKWKRFIGSQAHYPPPSENTTNNNKVESNVSNIIDIEDEEKEDIDLLHINTINKISNTDIDDTDIGPLIAPIAILFIVATKRFLRIFGEL